MKRGRGRPPKTEHEQDGQLAWLERLLGEETEALRLQGYRGHKQTKALLRAAARLGISESTAWRIVAEMKQQDELFIQSIASFVAFWQELYGSPRKKNDGTDLLTVNTCGAG